MTEEEMHIFEDVWLRWGKISKSYLMKKMKCTWDQATILENRFNDILYPQVMNNEDENL